MCHHFLCRLTITRSCVSALKCSEGASLIMEFNCLPQSFSSIIFFARHWHDFILHTYMYVFKPAQTKLYKSNTNTFKHPKDGSGLGLNSPSASPPPPPCRPAPRPPLLSLNQYLCTVVPSINITRQPSPHTSYKHIKFGRWGGRGG